MKTSRAWPWEQHCRRRRPVLDRAAGFRHRTREPAQVGSPRSDRNAKGVNKIRGRAAHLHRREIAGAR
jgi:hypothetical protein